MARRRRRRKPSIKYEAALDASPLASRLVVVVACVAALVAMTQGGPGSGPPVDLTPAITLPVAVAANSSAELPAPTAPSSTPDASEPSPTEPSSDPLPTPAPSAPRIGIVAGHSGHDTGAMCPDGLMEVDINQDVAERVVYILTALGYRADLLTEFDPRLQDYRADTLISIHADSCEPFPNADPPASGFKVASVEDSLVPEAERRLVQCLAGSYAARTGMYFHETSITVDMTSYHTFYEIHDDTPGAIIETGFMYADRTMLTERADLVAQGIVEGIVCFIEAEH